MGNLIEMDWQEGKHLKVELGKTVTQVLEKRQQPVYVDLELYFSCLIRKRVHISDHADESKDYHRASEWIYVAFSPVMTQACEMDPEKSPQLVSFPIKKPQAYLPKWLKLDVVNNEFVGEFGYSA